MLNTNKNIAIVWQPKWVEHEIWPAVRNSKGKETNYIIVCCSEEKNGIYSWDPSIIPNLELVMNGKIPCYRVPLDALTWCRDLDSTKGSFLRSLVRQEQQAFIKYKRKVDDNPNYKPRWTLMTQKPMEEQDGTN